MFSTGTKGFKKEMDYSKVDPLDGKQCVSYFCQAVS